ncbi:MAG: PTS sugar transporter subunit IIA [Candidatus Cloacimonetes bacterium]|jgi:PTS system nitrogen regulatory IIA component|nr:PTS sugar transporter subunit IIA [Candidatus Cloacimonadota bacterium]MCB5286995.1 PTS sugar transporter subunit IIA [Candidatus Cloacimonadota bacterium]MCK9185509.1 PTS sugar transporter subunit IIA [Candidatus Cloacimonadota bacterium]MCK9584788.1 PTS sugar transporter subunit IIA [Candidatus Cloacimonadota bacterium]MDY0229315.1 PTS sugar transporter subunit IIA [Candidatus Cloacimonadaceae bacterium]
MLLSEVIKLESCSIEFGAEDKDDALHKLAALFKRSRKFEEISEGEIYKALKDREALGSTGFARGIAMPHCGLDRLDSFAISLAVCKKGVDFDSMDRRKTKVFVCIVGPKNASKQHLQLLASCSHILKQPGVVDDLLQATSRINLFEEFLEHADNGSGRVDVKGKEKLLLLFVKDEHILQDITEVFVEYGIQRSTIINTTEMENLISTTPLFMGFFNFTGDKSPTGKIVLAKIVEDHIDAIINGLEDIFGDLNAFSDLDAMVLDVFYAKGF